MITFNSKTAPTLFYSNSELAGSIRQLHTEPREFILKGRNKFFSDLCESKDYGFSKFFKTFEEAKTFVLENLEDESNKVREALNHTYTDLLQLVDEELTNYVLDATISNVELIAKSIGHICIDTRDQSWKS